MLGAEFIVRMIACKYSRARMGLSYIPPAEGERVIPGSGIE